MIDPTFFDYQTKKVMRHNSLKDSACNLYHKDLIVKELTRLRHKKYGAEASGKRVFERKRPGSQISMALRPSFTGESNYRTNKNSSR